MSKKDYELIATVFRDAREQNITDVDEHTLAILAWMLAVALRRQNSRFDFDRFERACRL